MSENTAASSAQHAQASSTDYDATDEVGMIDLLQVLAEHVRLLVLAPVCAGALALGYSYTIAPTFTASTKFIPPQQQQSSAAAMLSGLGNLGGLAGAAGVSSALKNPAEQYVAFLKSRSLKDALIERLKLEEHYERKSREALYGLLDDRVRVSIGKDNLITVDADDQEPAFAAKLANAHVEELGKLLNRLAITAVQQKRLFFEKQLATARDNLVKAEQALRITGINSSAIKASPVAAVETVAKIKASIALQQIKLSSMSGYLTSSAPDFKRVQAELAALRSQLAQTERTEPDADGAGSDYVAKYRDFKYQETLFDLYAKQYEMARLDESRDGAAIQVLDEARPPEHKSRPQKLRVALTAALITWLVLLPLIFIRQGFKRASRRSNTARKVGDLRQTLAKAFGRA